MSRARWKAAVVLTALPLLLACYAAELLLTYPPKALVLHPRFYNAARFDAIGASRRHRQQGKLVYPVTASVFYSRHSGAAGEPLAALPLASVARSAIVLCNETGTDLIIPSDRHGFSNPDSVWNGHSADIALVGDSFTHGECVGPRADIASHLRSRYAVFNGGLSGAGPLTELGVLREYVSVVRPRVVFWLFFEGNDMEDLAAEKATAVSAYLDGEFSQGLASRGETVDSIARALVDSVVGEKSQSGRSPSPEDVVLLRRLRGLLGFSLGPRPEAAPADYSTLAAIVRSASAAVKAWGGHLVIVYLPDRRRFSGERTTISAHHDLDEIRAEVLAIARREQLPVVDIAARFGSDPAPAERWRSPRSHYTPDAYRTVAQAMAAAVDQPNRQAEGSSASAAH